MRIAVQALFITLLVAVGPLHAQDKKPKEKVPATSRTILADLRTESPIGNNEPLKLSELLALIGEVLKKNGKEVIIALDEAAYREEAPDAPPMLEQNLTFRNLPAKPNLGQLLREGVKQLPVKSAIIIRAGRLDIVPAERATKEYMLNQTFEADFKGKRLDDALDELSELTGVSIVLDGRVGEKQLTTVTARFRDDVALQDAVRMLADMADLKMVYLVTGIYVTTPERAKAMQKELRDLYEPPPAQAGPMGGLLPKGAPAGGIGPGPLPGNGGIITEPSPLAPPLPPSRKRLDRAA